MAWWSCGVGAATLKLNVPFLQKLPYESTRGSSNPLRCIPVQQQAEPGIICEPCSGRGWLLCDFCEGKKTNVKGANNRIYRRCPSCKAVGYILCSKCKVFKCVTFPNYNDGEELSF